MAGIADTEFVHEMAAAEGSVKFKASIEPGYVHTLTIEESWDPAAISEYRDPHQAAFDELVGPDADPEAKRTNKPWFNYASFWGMDNDSMAISPKRFEGVTRGLGFSLADSNPDDPQTGHRTRRYTYPSIELANDLIEEAFGDEELEFTPYEGGEYTAEEFMRQYVEGKVLIATEHPHDIHDLSDHVIGWMGMDPQFSEIFRSRIGVYLERLDAERAVRPVLVPPAIEEQPHWLEEQREFFLPSLAVIKVAMRNIEAVTSRIARSAIGSNSIYDQYENLPRRFGSQLGEAFDSHSSAMYYQGIETPSGLLGSLTSGEESQFGEQTFLRFQQADQVGCARELALR